MRILNVPLGADTGGVSHQLGKALAKIPGVEFRSLISSLNYLDYPRDTAYTSALLREWWDWADVLHLHHSVERIRPIMKRLRLPKKPAVIHFHGTGFREDPDRYLREARSFPALPLVATLDLWVMVPDKVRWAPSPMEDLSAYRMPATDGIFHVVHAPTNRAIKGTKAVIEACAGMPGVELDLIERVTWRQCLTRKGKADVLVDQFQLGYGMNALEAWSMGIPVIAGAAPGILEKMDSAIAGALPFFGANKHTLAGALGVFRDSLELRETYAVLGRAYMAEYHTHPDVFLQAYREVSGW